MKRRSFLEKSLILAGGAALPLTITPKRKSVRFGIVTDLHFAVKESKINRYYKQLLKKLTECVNLMNKKQVDFLIEIGDLKDESVPPDEKATLQFLETIEAELQKFNGPCFHVLGNHDADCITKEQFLSKIKNGNFPDSKSAYSFVFGEYQFVVLDANFRADGVAYRKGNFKWTDCHIPEDQLHWLKKKLSLGKPTVVFVHQRLDSLTFLKDFCPDNADEVRAVLEDSGNVLAVFQGHDHKGGFNSINKIPYYTLKGLIEGSGPDNNSYAVVELRQDRKEKFVVDIKGFRKAQSLVLR